MTVKRHELASVSSHDFKVRGDDHQCRFAAEIERVSKQYFVQTPYLYFPVESHSWIPGMQFGSQRTRRLVSLWFKKYWIKQWTADFYLYDWRRFRSHFGKASFFFAERILGITKSLIAVRTQNSSPQVIARG